MSALVVLSYQNDENKLYHPWLLVFCDCCAKTAREANSMEPSERGHQNSVLEFWYDSDSD